MAAVFISYRREDAAGYAGRLRESLERRVGVSRVFRDVDTLTPGQDFVQAIEARLADCRVMLVVIGREWLDARHPGGGRRLDDPYDFVRLEIASGLGRANVLLIPVLVEGVAMPPAPELPESIRPLARRHAVSVRDETWDADIDRLAAIIDAVDTGVSAGAVRRFAGSRPTRWLVAAAVAAAAMAVGAVIGWQRDSADAGRQGEPPAETAAVPADREPGSDPFTIDVPRISEAAFGPVIYGVASGNVVPRPPAQELRLRVRMFNFSSTPHNLWNASFRLTVDGDSLTPTSDLNMVVPGNSLRYGIVTFRLPTGTSRATLQIQTAEAAAAIPLDLAPTGRPPVDEQADIADSLARAIIDPVPHGPAPLIDAERLALTIERVTARRFANTVRLTVSTRLRNDGPIPRHTGAFTLRALVAGTAVAAWDAANDVVEASASTAVSYAFDLPPGTAAVVLRASLGTRSAERALTLPERLR